MILFMGTKTSWFGEGLLYGAVTNRQIVGLSLFILIRIRVNIGYI